MHKECRSASAGKGGRHLAANMTRFAHPRYDHTRLAVQNALHSRHEFIIYAFLEFFHGIRFNRERFQRRFFYLIYQSYPLNLPQALTKTRRLLLFMAHDFVNCYSIFQQVFQLV